MYVHIRTGEQESLPSVLMCRLLVEMKKKMSRAEMITLGLWW